MNLEHGGYSDEDIGGLERRLAEVLEAHGRDQDPLSEELRFFGAIALTALKRQQKLIRISDTMQASIYEQRKALDRLNQEKALFFSIIAHDLRGPIYSLLNNLDLLADPKLDLDHAERQEVTETLRSSGGRVVSLLENLLEWASLNMNTMPYSPEPAPLNAAFSEVAQTLRTIAVAKELTLDFPTSTPLALADLPMLKSILRNLVGNAIKYSHQGGQVRMGCQAEGDRVRVWVADDGVGMEDWVRAELFNKAVKTATQGTQGEKGSGVGLILASELVDRHGGTLEVQSQPGQGATFSFTLPAVPPLD